MSFNPDFHHRRSIRLRGYDYSRAGAYSVTLCAWQRECLFGEVVDGEMMLNDAGRLVTAIWDSLPLRYQGLEVDAFVTMPNHIHGIIVINDPVGAIHESPGSVLEVKTRAIRESSQQGRRTMTLSKVVGYLKMNTAKGINQMRNNPGVPVWQRDYYERVIRDERELAAIRQYIADNPAKWAEDENHPARQ
ncbi:MAG: transposase [Trichloromonadaceae bacterium]